MALDVLYRIVLDKLLEHLLVVCRTRRHVRRRHRLQQLLRALHKVDQFRKRSAEYQSDVGRQVLVVNRLCPPCKARHGTQALLAEIIDKRVHVFD